MSHALIVEDDPDTARTMAALIEMEHFTVATAHTLRDAKRQLALQPPDIVLLDLQLPDGSGMDLFDEPRLIGRSEIVLITGRPSLETSVAALRLGAADYLTKPINVQQLQGILSRLMPPAVWLAELDAVETEWAKSGRFGHLWGRSSSMRRVYDQIARVAGTAVTVFITGESGTGKELVARTVHDLSRRRGRPFLAVNCGALSTHLIESELFGHEKGAFTGADRQHQGFFEQAHGGTLFLDEVGEMAPDLQVKLLRVLETGTFSRVGSTTLKQTDVRVIAATNRDPQQAVACGRLREDLLYRLNVFPIAMPRLRERLEDVPLMAAHFLDDIGRREGAVRRFAPAALARLSDYRWPGNVRELRNAVQRAYVMAAGDVVTDEWLPLPGPALREAGAGGPAAIAIALGTSLADAERQLILATLRHFRHHRERTAAALGISLKTLYNRLKEYDQAAEGGEELPPAA